MTIDEMIKFLENDKNSNIMSDTSRWDIAERRQFDQIIAALKAGQQMYKDFDDNEVGYTAGQAAWDAATKGDE